MIVDNSIHSYSFNMRNGVPILPYFDDKFDTELYELEKYLVSLVTSYDLRPLIEDQFLIKIFEKYYSNQLELIKQIYKGACEDN